MMPVLLGIGLPLSICLPLLVAGAVLHWKGLGHPVDSAAGDCE